MRAGRATLGLWHERFARAMSFAALAPCRSSCGAPMVAWIVWLIVAALLGGAELATFPFALGLIAVGACVAGAAAAFDLGLPFQLLAFVIASVAGLGVVLPTARRHIRQPPLLRTGPAALVGRSAHVLEEV